MGTDEELERRVRVLEDELQRERSEHERTMQILELAVTQMPATYWIVDRDLRIVRNGGAIERIMGYPAERFLGKTMHDAVAADPSGGDDFIDAHMRALGGEIRHLESNYRGKLHNVVVAPYHDASGEIIGVIGTSLDVTAPRLLERRMVDTQRAESLGVLAGGLAHDFNNLLVAVIGNADLALRELAEGKSTRNPILNMRDAGLRAAELVEQLLAYAGRGGAGTTRVPALDVVEELLRILAPAIPKNVRISVDIPSKLAVRADPAQFRQVLLNLINNAREALAGRAGSIEVSAASVHADGAALADDILTPQAGSYAMIEVKDDGPGMDCETRRHVFEPFFTTKPTGHGLGLAAVLGIVRAHDGGIRLSSRPGEGAAFQVLWPAASSAAIRATSQPPAAKTVLVVDDEDLVRDVVARMVVDLGYAVLTASDGKTALELVEHQPVDAVLVDLTMPHMSGADVVAALRERRPDLPIVLCSGYDRNGRGTVAADAFLAKPFRLDALERTLAKLLPLRSV